MGGFDALTLSQKMLAKKPVSDSMAGRMALMMRQYFGGDAVKLARAARMPEIRLAEILEGELPTEDEIERLLNTEGCPINPEWLKQGKGDMIRKDQNWLIYRSTIELNIDTQEREDGFKAMLNSFQSSQEAQDQEIKSLEVRAKGWTKQIQDGVNGWAETYETENRKWRKEFGEKIAFAIKHDIEQVQEFTKDEIASKIKDVGQIVVDEIKLRKLATTTDMDALEALIEEITHETRQAIKAQENRINQDQAFIEVLSRRISELEGKFASIASRSIDEIDPIKYAKNESELPPQAFMTLRQWCEFPGPHLRVVRDEEDRRTAGGRLTAAYRQSGYRLQFENGGNGSGTYAVDHMRHYAIWLSRAGLNPTQEDWLEYWSKKTRV